MSETPAPARPPIELEVRAVGRVSYVDALELQEEATRRCLDGGPGTLLLLEHPHVVTLGRNARDNNVLVPEDELRRRGVELHSCGRGGDVTYHGPGQLVGYPVMLLPEGRRSIHGYVRDLEEALIRTVADYGIIAARDPGYPGVWIGRRKIAALGVRIARWVTSHGFALNVATDLSYFGLITPCGLRDRGVTSMQQQLDDEPAMADVEQTIARHLVEIFAGDAIRAAHAPPHRAEVSA